MTPTRCTPERHLTAVMGYQEHFAIQEKKVCKFCKKIVTAIKLEVRGRVTLWQVS